MQELISQVKDVYDDLDKLIDSIRTLDGQDSISFKTEVSRMQDFEIIELRIRKIKEKYQKILMEKVE